MSATSQATEVVTREIWDGVAWLCVNLDVAATLNAARAPEKTEFVNRVREQGLRKALDRDSRYGALT